MRRNSLKGVSGPDPNLSSHLSDAACNLIPTRRKLEGNSFTGPLPIEWSAMSYVNVDLILAGDGSSIDDYDYYDYYDYASTFYAATWNGDALYPFACNSASVFTSAFAFKSISSSS